MTQIFLAPVSGARLFNNYKKTVEIGFDLKDFIALKATSSYQKLLDPKAKVRLWGVKDLKISQYKQCRINDYLFFYHKGEIISTAKIISLDKNLELSNLLWGYEKNDLKNTTEYWDNIVFLDSFVKVNFDFQILIQYASYEPKASVRGFNKYREEGVSKILNEHGSIDKFLSAN